MGSNQNHEPQLEDVVQRKYDEEHTYPSSTDSPPDIDPDSKARTLLFTL